MVKLLLQKRFLLCCSICMLLLTAIEAQDFITRGKIEFEIKRNNKKLYASYGSESNDFVNSLPEFDVTYRDLLFSFDKSIYQPGRLAATTSMYMNENSVYTDLEKQQIILKTQQGDQYYVYEDSLKAIKWKIENETRKIMGWECRKAVGRIFDSVYVVAFYCPEIIPQGGPEKFSGLPGMILGLAIPRYFTTWFATKIELASIDESKIKPPSVKKGKQYSRKEIIDILYKKYKEAGWLKMTVEEFAKDFYTYTL